MHIDRLRGIAQNCVLLLKWLNSLSAALDSVSLRLRLKNPQGNNSLDLTTRGQVRVEREWRLKRRRFGGEKRREKRG